ncbi:MAG TPA: GNAT family N-acetyltransferase [Mycobacteriales bacterium]|nr:GNAT family N-acetyltransferase [Mycobacteriales bacterium]
MGVTAVRLERCSAADVPAADRYADHTGFQLDEWTAFLRETQHGEPVYARVVAGGETVGRFSGLVVRRYGLRLLGSPLPGWTTAYLGFNLRSGVARTAAVRALEHFALRELGCAHFEVMDRGVDPASAGDAGLRFRTVAGFEIDLARAEDDILAGMSSACRRCVRKAAREGVTVEVADDPAFVDDYYTQLQEVFGRQGLVPTYPRQRVEALVRHVAPSGRLLLLRARTRAGACVATGIFPAANGLMYFWGGASTTGDRLVRPNEAIQWAAMRYWRARGVTRYDMGGGGEYKRKYGGREIAVPWFRGSRYAVLEPLRSGVRAARDLRQRLAPARPRAAPSR